jgi:hypothetical protein
MVLMVSFGLATLIGCHPTFQGSLTPREGTGTGPTPSPGQAQITGASPASAVAGTAAFTLTVTGLNFVSTTSVIWDGTTTLDTIYVSSTTLKAQVPAALIAKPTTVTIVPTPRQTFNFGTTLTVTVPPLAGNNSFSLSKVTVAANDFDWNPANQQFYLSVASANGTNANSIAALSPQTGALGGFTAASSQPWKIAVSTDGTYLYAGLDSAGSVHRYTLPALQSDLDIPLGSNRFGPYYAIDVQAEPGNAHSVAVSRGVAAISPLELGGVLIYDDAVARPQHVLGFGQGPGPIDTLVWNTNATSLYGIDAESGSGVYLMSVNSAGVQLQAQTSSGGSGSHLHFDATTGYLYSDNGVVTDPVTQAVIGSFPLNAIQGGFSGNTVMVTDAKLNIAYFLGQTNYAFGSGNYALEAYDLSHFTFLGAIPLTGIAGTPSKMMRWGTNGLAFLTGDAYGRGAAGDGVYLVSGGFVTSPGR